MRPEDRDCGYLWDILDRAGRIRRYVEGRSLADYLKDQALQDAVERCVEVIGEAARRVSGTFRDAHPEIPWRAIIAQRNILSHEYDEIRPERVYRVAVGNIPELIEKLEPLIPPAPTDEPPAGTSPEPG